MARRPFAEGRPTAARPNTQTRIPQTRPRTPPTRHEPRGQGYNLADKNPGTPPPPPRPPRRPAQTTRPGPTPRNAPEEGSAAARRPKAAGENPADKTPHPADEIQILRIRAPCEIFFFRNRARARFRQNINLNCFFTGGAEAKIGGIIFKKNSRARTSKRKIGGLRARFEVYTQDWGSYPQESVISELDGRPSQHASRTQRISTNLDKILAFFLQLKIYFLEPGTPPPGDRPQQTQILQPRPQILPTSPKPCRQDPTLADKTTARAAPAPRRPRVRVAPPRSSGPATRRPGEKNAPAPDDRTQQARVLPIRPQILPMTSKSCG